MDWRPAARIGRSLVGVRVVTSSTLALASVAWVFVFVPVARADTVIIGSTALVSNGPNVDLFTQGVPVFQGDASGNYVLSSPVSGTVTSWRFMSGGAVTGNRFVLRVLRPADATGASWMAVGTSAPQAVASASGTDGVEGPFAANLTIQAGDRIALEPETDGNMPIESGVNGQDGVRFFASPLVDGNTAAIDPASTMDNGQVVPIQATVQFAPPVVAPVNASPPAISGTRIVGQRLACSTGTWTNSPTGFAYQWFADGAPTAGQTGPMHVIAAGEAGHQLTCRVTASNAGGSASATSAPVTPASGPPSPVIATGPLAVLGGQSLRGTVTVTPPHGRRVRLRKRVAIGFGSLIDATHGAVQLLESGIQRGTFYGGAFTVGRDRAGVIRIALHGGSFAGCRSRRSVSGRGSGSLGRPIRRLWASVEGGFRTVGRDAGAVSNGAAWETSDACGGTGVLVKQGILSVQNLVRSQRQPVPIVASTAAGSWTLELAGGKQQWSLGSVTGLSTPSSVTVRPGGALRESPRTQHVERVAFSFIAGHTTAGLLTRLRGSRVRHATLTFALTSRFAATTLAFKGTVSSVAMQKSVFDWTIVAKVKSPVVSSPPPPPPPPSSDGPVWAWGRDDSALGYTATGYNPGVPGGYAWYPANATAFDNPFLAGRLGDSVSALAAGPYTSLALMSNGAVVAWGLGGSGRDAFAVLGGPPSRDVFKAISAGGDNLALDNSGHVWGWPGGFSHAPGLGNCLACAFYYPHLPPDAVAVKISAGGSHNLALLSDLTVEAWGDNSVGQLGTGNTSTPNLPVQVPGLSMVTAIAAGSDHSLALLSDGTVMAWGDNEFGQLGNGSPSDVYSASRTGCPFFYNRSSYSATPVRVNLPPTGAASPVVAIAAGGDHSLALLADGTIVAWGDNEAGQVKRSLGSRCVDYPVNSVAPAQLSSPPAAIAATLNDSYVVEADRHLEGWGDNTYGQLGFSGGFPISINACGNLPVHFNIGFPRLRCSTTEIGGGCCTQHVLAVALPQADITPTTLDFGIQGSGTQSITVQSVGPETLTVSHVRITGDGDFVIVHDTCTGASLTLGKTCDITVHYDVGAAGPRNATLSIDSDAPSSPNNVALSANGGP
jgi:alpha-tubulin suppressor-like RCC1 family protein